MDAAVAALGELRSLKELMFIPTSSLTVDSDVVTALKPSVVRGAFPSC